MTQIVHSIPKSRCVHLLLKVRERRFEHIVIIVVNGDRPLWIHEVHDLEALFPIHRNHNAEHPMISYDFCCIVVSFESAVTFATEAEPTFRGRPLRRPRSIPGALVDVS